MHPSLPGPTRVGVTTHEALRLLGLTFRTDASIDRVEAGRLLTWHAHDRQKQLRGSRLVEPTGLGTCRFTEVVEVRLLGLLRPLEPLVARINVSRACLADQGWMRVGGGLVACVSAAPGRVPMPSGSADCEGSWR
jgi:hypothetical protein